MYLKLDICRLHNMERYVPTGDSLVAVAGGGGGVGKARGLSILPNAKYDQYLDTFLFYFTS